MMMSRRALLAGTSTAPLVSSNPAPATPVPVFRVVNTTGLTGRTLVGTDLPREFVGTSFYADDGCRGRIELPGTHFGIPEYVGPYVTDDGDGDGSGAGAGDAVFRKRTGPVRVVIDGMRLDDVHQGLVGDCWFLSALDFSLHHPKYRARITDGLLEVLDEASCACKVTLYDPGTDRWQQTCVGPQLLLEGTRFPAVVSATSSDANELWPGIVEKALAKMCRTPDLTGYAAIGGGWMSEAMCYLHGRGKCYYMPHSEFLPVLLQRSADSNNSKLEWFMTLLMRMLEEGYGLFVAWDKEMFKQLKVDSGLADKHAYSILNIARNHDATWTLTLKNPWGHGTFKGAPSRRGVFAMDALDVLSRCAGFDVYEPHGMTILQDHGVQEIPLVV